jgi:hypothetical protein|tara:strand:- start:295 stop:642 length:348 start_codon:yes stop_codon:yes gene_type:complete
MIHPYIKPIALIFFLVLLRVSCDITKLTANKTVVTYQKEGYLLGTIIPKDTGNCGWIITDSKNNTYDPINITDQKFLSFSLKKETIYFKFLPLRMKNRCKNTSPIALVEVILATN